MKKYSFDDIRNKQLLIYEYVRGSTLYHTNTEDSDIDTGGVYLAPTEQVIGLGLDYQTEISDDKHDTTWWELGRFLNLALTSNPTVLEALFVPDDMVIYEHPIMKEIRKHRDKFITKACFKPFGGYAVSQIAKAQGLKKLIHWDMEDMKRKTPLDFCFVPYGQGSANIVNWLEHRGLNQRYCGLVSLNNMPSCYGVYYDFGQHYKDEGWYSGDLPWNENPKMAEYMSELKEKQSVDTEWCIGYRGIVGVDGKSNEVRCSSIPKYQEPIIPVMSFNINGYQTHCKKYKEYEEWKKKRNKARYENNIAMANETPDTSKFYDCKNMMHCFRLVHMCTEIAQGDGVLLDRTGIDRDFLMDVRNRKYKYGELFEQLTKDNEMMDAAIEKSTLPEAIDIEFVNDLLINIRKNYLK